MRRRVPRRLRLRNLDRLILVTIFRLIPATANALAIVKPATVIRLHRLGFRAYWRWKSRPSGGRPRVSTEIRQLIRQMSLDNPLWGAPRIHGELLKLGIDVGQTTVAPDPMVDLPRKLITVLRARGPGAGHPPSR